MIILTYTPSKYHFAIANASAADLLMQMITQTALLQQMLMQKAAHWPASRFAIANAPTNQFASANAPTNLFAQANAPASGDKKYQQPLFSHCRLSSTSESENVARR
jgi:hypothetical protein